MDKVEYKDEYIFDLMCNRKVTYAHTIDNMKCSVNSNNLCHVYINPAYNELDAFLEYAQVKRTELSNPSILEQLLIEKVRDD